VPKCSCFTEDCESLFFWLAHKKELTQKSSTLLFMYVEGTRIYLPWGQIFRGTLKQVIVDALEFIFKRCSQSKHCRSRLVLLHLGHVFAFMSGWNITQCKMRRAAR
jgi:hypothetical protein